MKKSILIFASMAVIAVCGAFAINTNKNACSKGQCECCQNCEKQCDSNCACACCK